MADNKIDTKKEFLNVYNFVPFAKKKARKYECQDELTGVITYSITTKTPLFIPNSSSDHAFQMEKDVPQEHKSYDFYSYREMDTNKVYDKVPEKPIIPGSELRGMIRGIYETLTASCMGVLNEDVVPSLRTAEIFRAGLIHRVGKNRFELVAAKKYRYCEGGDKNRYTYKETSYREGQKVYFQRVPYGKTMITACKTEKRGNYTCEGYLIKGMGDQSLGNKHHAGIFQAKYKQNGSEKSLLIERERVDNDIVRLRSVLKSYTEHPEAEENCYQEYKENLEGFLSGKGEAFFPVYYSIVSDNKGGQEDRLYLSPACITRELSHYSIGQLAGEFAPCKSAETMCPACDLFGRVGESNEDSHASKLRFTDAYPEQDIEPEQYGEYYERVMPITLENLAEPKLGATEFYVSRPAQASFWTYDYYVQDRELYCEMGKLRGRKYYWHQPNVVLPKNIEKTKLNKTVRPVKKEVTFIGKVYFDKISEKQLEQMKWILNCGEDGSDLAYKLGTGKPLGLGSVECKVIEVKERKVGIIDGKMSYSEDPHQLDIRNYDDLDFSKSSKNEFLCMNSFHAAEDVQQISYPVTADQFGKPLEEGFKWFVQNRGGQMKGRKGIRIAKSLPLASSIIQFK